MATNQFAQECRYCHCEVPPRKGILVDVWDGVDGIACETSCKKCISTRRKSAQQTSNARNGLATPSEKEVTVYVCGYCKEVFSQPEIYFDKPVHVCNPWYYEKAICVENHNCEDYTEEIFDESGNFVRRCVVCYAVAQQAPATDSAQAADKPGDTTPETAKPAECQPRR